MKVTCILLCLLPLMVSSFQLPANKQWWTTKVLKRVTTWKAGICARPKTGACAEAGTCCGQLKGLKQWTRECKTTAPDCKLKLEKFRFACNINCDDDQDSNAMPDTYIGCFVDRGDSRDLPVLAFHSNSANIDQCIKRCRARGYKYTGIQFGNECWCGNSYGRWGEDTPTDDSDCSMPCAGDASQICGGADRNSIHAVM